MLGGFLPIIRGQSMEALVSEWLHEWSTIIVSALALAAALLLERCRSMGRTRRNARIKELDRLRRLGN
jgi:hypothetical protein